MSLSAMMQDSVTIYRYSRSVASRNKTQTKSTVATAVSCLIQHLSGNLATAILGRIPTATHLIFFNATQDIKESDKIYDGTNYYIVNEVNVCDSPFTAHHKEITAELTLDAD